MNRFNKKSVRSYNEKADHYDNTFDGRTFDLITVCAAYHHFPDVKAFAAESHRLLKTEGCLYIADVYYPALVRFLCNPFVPLRIRDSGR